MIGHKQATIRRNSILAFEGWLFEQQERIKEQVDVFEQRRREREQEAEYFSRSDAEFQEYRR